MVKGICIDPGWDFVVGAVGPATVPSSRRRELMKRVGRCGVPVAESALAPPGPIPNPVVTQRSAGEYCSGNAVGGEAAAGAPHRRTRVTFSVALTRGGAVAARWAHNPKVGGSNPPPATSRQRRHVCDVSFVVKTLG